MKEHLISGQPQPAGLDRFPDVFVGHFEHKITVSANVINDLRQKDNDPAGLCESGPERRHPAGNEHDSHPERRHPAGNERDSANKPFFADQAESRRNAFAFGKRIAGRMPAFRAAAASTKPGRRITGRNIVFHNKMLFSSGRNIVLL
ncbi:MAG: hypothetical protein JSS81_01535 [Acidobacteria bacterium]|nr:hypothetical protein [Acidobacteriota bacterium]